MAQQNQTHQFIATVTGCDAEQAHQAMAERLSHDEDYGFDYRVDYHEMPTHAGVCSVENRTEVVLADSQAEAEENAGRRTLAALAQTNWTEDNEDFTAAEMERTAATGTAAEVAALLQDASNEGAFEREDISWGSAEIVRPVDTSEVLEPEPVSVVLERMIAAGTAAPAARDMPAGTVLRELMQANATDRVRATFEYGLVIEATPTMSGPHNDWTIGVPNFGLLGGTAEVLIATDASGSQVVDALGWSTHLTDLQLLEPDVSDED